VFEQIRYEIAELWCELLSKADVDKLAVEKAYELLLMEDADECQCFGDLEYFSKPACMVIADLFDDYNGSDIYPYEKTDPSAKKFIENTLKLTPIACNKILFKVLLNSDT
jgi:hypothetical protein